MTGWTTLFNPDTMPGILNKMIERTHDQRQLNVSIYAHLKVNDDKDTLMVPLSTDVVLTQKNYPDSP